jgi:hypothetical protein
MWAAVHTKRTSLQWPTRLSGRFRRGLLLQWVTFNFIICCEIFEKLSFQLVFIIILHLFGYVLQPTPNRVSISRIHAVTFRH